MRYPWLIGVDLSKFNIPSQIWPVVDSIGATWAYFKCTSWSEDGGHVIDPRCDEHIAQARSRGRLFGLYHFLDSRSSPEDQAEFHWQQCLRIRPTLRSMVDVEPVGSFNKPSLVWVERFAARFEALSGFPPVVYCGWGYVDTLGRASSIARCPLWDASYPGKLVDDLPVERPRVPLVWSGRPIRIYQFTDSTTHGLRPGLDRNVSSGWVIAALEWHWETGAPVSYYSIDDCADIFARLASLRYDDSMRTLVEEPTQNTSRAQAEEAIRNMGRTMRDRGVPPNADGQYVMRIGSGQRMAWDPVYDSITEIGEADQPNRKTRRAQAAVIRAKLADARKKKEKKRAKLAKQRVAREARDGVAASAE